jgi:hypothetical protein
MLRLRKEWYAIAVTSDTRIELVTYETHVLDTSDVFRALKVLACAIGATFSCVVNKVFCDLLLSVFLFPFESVRGY